MTDIQGPKKRGRKPKKSKVEPTSIHVDESKSEDENIILHLPITIEEINESKTVDSNDIDYFIKPAKVEKTKHHPQPKTDASDSIDTIVNNSCTNKSYLNVYCNNINKIITHCILFSKNTRCWWCRNTFLTIPIQIPDDYYNNIFYCIGHFCSFNCGKSFNLDLNDNMTWKRESLLNLLYFKTYSQHVHIIPAPSWIVLEDYGGNLSIEQFRDCFITNTKEYTVLHPPIISRQMQIEESYKINKIKEVPINNVNKIYSEIESEYSLKRSRPIKSSQLNLETTMGLVRGKK